MKVVCLVKNMDGCTYHRIYMPHKFVDAEVRNVVHLSEDDFEWADIIVYSRHYLLSPVFINEMKKKHNVKIVVDTDDSVVLQKSHPNYLHYIQGDSFLQVRQHLMYADAVITTHGRLKEEALTMNPNVFVIPNAIAYGKEQFVPIEKTKRDKLTMLYASSNLNYINTELIKGVFDDMDIHIHVLGDVGGHYSDVIRQNLTGGKVEYSSEGWRKIDEYMLGYDGDFMIVPNKPIHFNAMKSNLKILEAACARIPIIVTPSHPYIDEPFPVLYANNKKEWREMVERMYDESYRNKMASDLYDYCKEHYDLEKFGRLRTEIYDHILSTP